MQREEPAASDPAGPARGAGPDRDAEGGGRARLRRAWGFGGALVVAVLLATIAVALNDLRVRRDAGARYLQALVDSHARQIGNRLDGVERALHGLANGLEAIEETWPDAAPVFAREQIGRIVSGHPHVRSLRVADAAPDFVPVEAGVRYRLYLGRPAPTAADGHWLIPLAMPFQGNADGNATRWLRAELDADAFTGILGAHEVGVQGVSSLLTGEGTLIARSDSGTRHAGLDALGSPVFTASAEHPRGLVRTKSRMDGTVRWVGYREIEGRPLIATVGMTPEALYGGWKAFATTLALGMLILVVVWLAGMAFLMRAARRESRMRRDLVEHEHAVDHLQERVRDAEEQYRFLYQQHPLPAFVYDRENMVLLEANQAAELQFGYPPGGMTGLRSGQLLAEETEDDVRREMQAHPQSLGRRVWVMQRGDGSRFHALTFGRDLVSFDGRPARLVLALDVTDRERAEANLRLLRRAVDASEEGVFILDGASERRGALVYGNAAFARLTGVDPERARGSNHAAVDAIIDPAARKTLVDAMDRAQDLRLELEDRRDPQAHRFLEVRLTPVLDGAGAASHFVGVVTDVTLRKRAAQEMAFRASHDALTGLANRDRLIEEIDGAIARGTGPLVVCHLDLDRFQLVNDSLGHGVGDELLVAVARRLEAAAGPEARVARLGGDEFGILLPLAEVDSREARVETLRMAVAGTVEVRGAALHVTPSLGYSSYPGDGGDGTTLMRAASQAGAQAKRMGRNRSVGYCHDFDSHAGDRLLLVQELHRALDEEEFELAFQLQFDAGGAPCGMEALVRWRHPERGLLGPGAFIEACEDSGLVLPLGRWVLREAARCWRLLDGCGWGALRMGVNISALQFQEGLVDEVEQVIREFSLPRGRLELELTESVLLDNPADAGRAMEALSQAGASLAIDDFGTGYSSLAYLKYLPLQRLKLDQSFVRDLGRDPDSEAICLAILRMAQGLGLSVIAEGVETAQQRDWLVERGCDELQGYLFARPQPFEAVLARLGPCSGEGAAEGGVTLA